MQSSPRRWQRNGVRGRVWEISAGKWWKTGILKCRKSKIGPREVIKVRWTPRSIPVNYKATTKIQKQIESKNHLPLREAELQLPGAYECHTGEGSTMQWCLQGAPPVTKPRIHNQGKLLFADSSNSIYFLYVFNKQIPKLFFARRLIIEFWFTRRNDKKLLGIYK